MRWFSSRRRLPDHEQGRVWRPILLLAVTSLLVPALVSAKDCRVKEFKGFAEQLDLSKLDSVLTLARLFEEHTKAQSSICVETLFVEFRALYFKARSQYEERTLQTIHLPGSSYPMEAERERALRSKLHQGGWELYETEGTYYIGENGTWFLDRFRPILTKPLIQYLSQRKLEIREGFSEDAGLLIPWEKLRKRIAFWERFLRENPDFPLQEEVSYYLQIYIRTFLTGLANSQITVTYNNKALRKDVKRAYEAYLIENKDSQYYQVVEGYYRILRKSDFTVTNQAKGYLEARGIKSMRSVQPPTY